MIVRALPVEVCGVATGRVIRERQRCASGNGKCEGRLGLEKRMVDALRLEGLAHHMRGTGKTGFGIAAVTKRDHFCEVLVGFGTNTFAEGADIDSVRVTFGGRREF